MTDSTDNTTSPIMKARDTDSPALTGGNQASRKFPQGKCVHQLFEEQAGRTPEAVAVEFENKPLTYRELNSRADRLASHLRRLGVGPEARVGICVERSADFAVAMLAVFKAGGALVPIEPDLPKERFEFTMADTQMPWLLTQSSLLDKLPPTGAKKICLDQEMTLIPDDGAGAVSQPEVTPQNLGYILYTSGSTGRPKGVLVTQEAYLKYCGAAIEYWQLKASDRVLQFAPFSFDVGIDQLLTPLLAGATVVVRGTELWDPARFTGMIKERGLTVVHLTPVYWKAWVETLSTEATGKSVGALRLVQVGGDVMPAATVRRWRELKLPSVRLSNRYGPTETTMFSTACDVPANGPADERVMRIPIGRPVGRRTIHILDAHGKSVPAGVAGEIHIGGETLARGYLNRPELTAERFIPDPFSGKPGARLYKTGDLGRMLPDGQYEFLGRADFQVKIRGYRIELEEIEAVLAEHPNVQSAVTAAHEDQSGDRHLVAYVVARESPLPNATELRGHLSAKLPDYMIPAKFIGVAALPRTPNGKVDRRALPPPNRPGAEDARDTLSQSEPAPMVATLTAEERHRLLFEWNQTEKSYPRDRCVHQLFEQQAERTPDATAVMFEGSSLTYRELNARANRAAHHLRSLGVGPETLVGICVERSMDMIIGLLAVLKAGGAFVPMTPDLPVARLALQMEDARLAVVLTQERLAARLPQTSANIICLDRLPAEAEDSYADNPQSGVALENLAYVIYTSGSTGRPKGVLIPHEALLSYCFSAMEWWRLEGSDRVLHFFNFSFDISIDVILSPLLAGAAIFIRGTGRWEPAQLTRAIKEHGLTVAGLPPAYWQQWVESLDVSAVSEKLASLRLVVLGGDAVPIGPVARWQEVAGASIRLVNAYGPTEATIFATAYEIPSRWPDGIIPRQVPIGRPLTNRTTYILDPQGNPVPVGAVGELFLGGDGLARGYLHQPELTAERFVPDPFGGKPGARLYRTGDLARYLPDGNVDFLGRTDFQVKIRGFRIELGEIEAALGGHPDVAACVVVAQERGGGEKELAAFVVGRGQAAPSVESLRLWLVEKLPDYMIPSRFLAVAALPLTSNGKVDRKALVKLDGVELASGVDYVTPRNAIERELVEIWKTVMGRERLGVRENFFDLGGHSLLAVAICSHINRRLGKVMPLRWVFEHPTVEAMAGRLESLASHSRDLGPMVERDREQPLPMSFAQQGMWLLQQTLPDPATYNQPVAWRLSGRVDREKVRRTLKAISGRHEILRTVLVQDGESLVQRVAAVDEVPLPWQEMDLQTVPPGQQQSALEKLLLEEACRPFDLAQAPLWRCVWVELAGEEHVLAFTFHHSIVDEWTWRLFFKELERLYAAGGRLELAGLPELPVQYADYSVQQRQRLTGTRLEEQRDYWREKLLDLPPALELPNQLARPIRSSGRGEGHHFQLTVSNVAPIRELARAGRTTLFTVMLAAFQVWLHRCTGQADVVVATPFADRERPEVQSLLGFFLNTLPIRVRLDGSSSFQQVLRQVRESLMGDFSHADLPFEQMVEMAVKERAPGLQPLHQVMFILLEEGLPALRLDQAEARLLPVKTRTSKCDLTLHIDAVGETWDCRIEYATDLFTAAAAAEMAGHFTELLHAITAHPDEPISRLNLLRPEERHRLLVDWNQTERDYPRDKCIHELFEAQARQSPDAVALELGGERMTYGELSRRSDHVARHLCALDVKPGERVGLSTERSFERVIGLLGILKAGAAYWALEDNLPAERLRTILADAQPKLILTGRKTAEKFPGTATVAAVEKLLAEPIEKAVDGPRSIRPEDPAYVSYTSGSTGQPKGVVVPHRGVVRLVKGMDYVSLTPDETLLHMSPLAFDASTFELWGALLNGGRVVLMPPGQPSLEEIGAAIRLHGVTTMFLTSGLFHLMVDHRLEDLKPLRQLLAGGDVLSREHVIKVRRALPDCRFIACYGPTENTTFTSCYTVPDACDSMATVPIGRPIANTRVYILDANLQPVPVGIAGELYCGGDGVACGYLNQPQQTAERFIPDPFSKEAGARLYRTGDRVRWLPDGNIEFLGRMDHQVKIRGYRIELGEIEATLLRHPAVRQAVVLARETAPGDKRLVAYVVPADSSLADVEPLRAFMRERLPDYMRPAAYVQMERLPLTPNGKVDQRALPAPVEVRRERGDGFAPPASPLQHQLAEIWEGLLGVRPIGMGDDFFELGGHSLLAVRMMHEIERVCGRGLPLSTLFEGATIWHLEQVLDQSVKSLRTPVTAIHPDGFRRPFFFLHGDFNGGGIYCISLARQIGPEQPFYALHPQGADDRAVLPSIEEMAKHHLVTLRATQPRGPYLLGGLCNGGLVAFEMAQRLKAEGERVDLLVLLDAQAGGRGSGWESADEGGEDLAATLEQIYRRAVLAYMPQRYHGLVTIFKSGDGSVANLKGAWQAVADEVRVFQMPGDHLSFITRHVRVLGEHLRACLEEAQSIGQMPAGDTLLIQDDGHGCASVESSGPRERHFK